MKIYGYLRVSSKTQKEARQHEFFDNHNIPMVNRYTDKISGSTAQEDRKGLMSLLSKVNEGDIVHFENTDRIARSVKEGIKILETLEALQVRVFIKGAEYNPDDADQEFMRGIELLIAQRMRKDMLKNQAVGIKLYKERGGKFGQAPTEITKEFQELNIKRQNKELTHKQVIEELQKINQWKSESTYYRMVRRLK